MSEEKPYTAGGLTRVINATRYSMQGIASAWENEAAFRQEFMMAVVLIPLGLWLGENGVERALLVGGVLLVLLVELLNSALENVVDRFGDEHHVLAGRAKDQGSAAVMVAILILVACWALILFPRLLD